MPSCLPRFMKHCVLRVHARGLAIAIALVYFVLLFCCLLFRDDPVLISMHSMVEA